MRVHLPYNGRQLEMCWAYIGGVDACQNDVCRISVGCISVTPADVYRAYANSSVGRVNASTRAYIGGVV